MRTLTQQQKARLFDKLRAAMERAASSTDASEAEDLVVHITEHMHMVEREGVWVFESWIVGDDPPR